MSNWIAEAHRDWHTETGLAYGCPWDACQPPDEYDYDEAEYEQVTIMTTIVDLTPEEMADAVAAGFIPAESDAEAWEPPF